MTSDPTNALMKAMDDPNKWKVTTGVPLFKAHRREFPNGEPVVVSDADLPGIAKKINETIRETGRLPTFTLGHRKFGPVDESTQPELLGFHRNFRAEPVTRYGKTFLALVADEYVPKDKAAAHELYRKYPFRSAEYHPKMGYAGAAALQQPPWLDLGTVYEYGADNPHLTYQTEAIPMDPNAQAPAANGQNGPDSDDVDPGMFEAWMKCYRKYAASMGGTNAAMPAAAGEKPVSYQQTAVDQTVAELQAKVKQYETALATEASKRLLDPIKSAYRFDYGRELNAMIAYQSEADRVAHVKYITENYAPLPTGGMIRVYQGDVKPAGATNPDTNGGPMEIDPHKPTADHQKILTYMRAHPGMDWDTAAAKVVA